MSETGPQTEQLIRREIFFSEQTYGMFKAMNPHRFEEILGKIVEKCWEAQVLGSNRLPGGKLVKNNASYPPSSYVFEGHRFAAVIQCPERGPFVVLAIGRNSHDITRKFH